MPKHQSGLRPREPGTSSDRSETFLAIPAVSSSNLFFRRCRPVLRVGRCWAESSSWVRPLRLGIVFTVFAPGPSLFSV